MFEIFRCKESLNCLSLSLQAREIRFLVSLYSERQFGAKTVSLVTVRITDINDNKPRFENMNERVIISEDLPVGSSITVIRAIDEDNMGLNSKLRYILEKVLMISNYYKMLLLSFFL